MPISLPTYFLPQPVATWDTETIESFEQLYRDVTDEAVAEIDYRLSAPKWQFLSYLCDQKHIVVHGSSRSDIIEFEPRKSNDVNPFGNRRAVYAASDGIWAMYFAIVNRAHVKSLVNGCFGIVEGEKVSDPYYFFSINEDALLQSPWQSGTIYLLPGITFERAPRERYRGLEIEQAQWASLSPVRPLAKISVSPNDFPFLKQVRTHDPAVLSERAAADPNGFPWF